jgi:hypothetical protein
MLLGFAIYFMVMRMRSRRERDSYLDEKAASSPRKVPSRLSSTFRTGNAITIKFNPPKSSDTSAPIRAKNRQPNDFPIRSSSSAKMGLPPTATPVADDTKRDLPSSAPTISPFIFNFAKQAGMPPNVHPSSDCTSSSWPLETHAVDQIDATHPAPLAPQPSRGMRGPHTPSLNLFESVETTSALSYVPLAPTEKYLNLDPTPNLAKGLQSTASTSFTSISSKANTDKLVEEIFSASIEELTTQKPQLTQIDENDDVLELEKPAHDDPFANPFEDPPPSLLEEPIKETIEEFIEELIEEPTEEPIEEEPFEDSIKERIDEKIDNPFENSLETRIDDQSEDMACGQLLQQPKRIPAPETLALLQEDELPRYSTMPEIDKLLRIVAQQNEITDGKPLFWSDFWAPDPEVERAMLLPSLREHSPVTEVGLLREIFPPRQSVVEPVGEEQRSRTLSPLRRNPVIDIATFESETFSPKQPPPAAVEQRETSHPPATSIEQKELSPLRQNPQFRNIDSFLHVQRETTVNAEKLLNGAGADVGEGRGRSMTRTSDIIEARLSEITRMKEQEKLWEEDVDQEEKERTASPLRPNPVDPPIILADHRDRTLSPLRRNPSNASFAKLHSRAPSLPPSLLSREESPLRRNPPNQNITIVGTSDSTSRSRSNGQFSQTLSRFQTIASQNPNDSIIASNEVTQRAIAGIHIPGSLREQAVRNLSKSRERGQSLARASGMASGSLSRSVSQLGGMRHDDRD